MPEYKLQSVHRNNGVPFSSFLPNQVDAQTGYVALYTCLSGKRCLFFLVGVIPRKQGLLKRFLKKPSGWKLGPLSLRFSGDLQNSVEVDQAIEALGYSKDPLETFPEGLPPIWFT